MKVRNCCFLLVLLFTVSCSNSDNQLPDLQPGILYDLVPYEELLNSDRVVFRDSLNNEQSFAIEHSVDILKVDEDLYWYNYSFERFRLVNEARSHIFTIYFRPFYRDQIVERNLDILMTSTGISGLTIVLDSLGVPMDGIKEDKILIGENFEDVIETTQIVTSNEAFSKMYFNNINGILGYKGAGGVLFVFDRFE